MNLLYTMEDVAVYGYITPLKVKIIIALALTDSVVRDADVLTVCTSPGLASVTLTHCTCADVPRFSALCIRHTDKRLQTHSLSSTPR